MVYVASGSLFVFCVDSLGWINRLFSFIIKAYKLFDWKTSAWAQDVCALWNVFYHRGLKRLLKSGL